MCNAASVIPALCPRPRNTFGYFLNEETHKSIPHSTQGVCLSLCNLGAGVEGSVSVAYTHIYAVLSCQINTLQRSPPLPLHTLPLHTHTNTCPHSVLHLALSGWRILPTIPDTTCAHKCTAPCLLLNSVRKPWHSFACQSDACSPPLPSIYPQTSPNHSLYSQINLPVDISPPPLLLSYTS